MNNFKILIGLVTLGIGIVGPSLQAGVNFSALEKLPVQDGGRKKPYLVVAQETSLGLAGRTSLEVDGSKYSAMDWVTQAWLNPQAWQNVPLILVNHLQLKRDAGLPIEQKLFRYDELVRNAQIRQMLVEASAQRAVGGRGPLSAAQKEAAEVGLRLALFESLLNGTLFRILPGEGPNWKSLPQNRSEFQSLQQAMMDGDQNAFDQAVSNLNSLSVHEPAVMRKISLELIYQKLHPFRWAWILYTAAGIVLAVTMWRRPDLDNCGNAGRTAGSPPSILNERKVSGFNQSVSNANCSLSMVVADDRSGTARASRPYPLIGYVVGWVFALAGFTLQLTGFVMRVLVSGRPPVSNMYESIIWVAFGTVLFGLIFEAIYRSRFFLLGAIPVAVVSLILADVQPLVLNPSITPLVAVLQSNFWLTTHVLTITLSYAAFALALGVAHIALGQVVIGRQPSAAVYNYIYKALQIGVLLLACGTILGAVWANYSWGRFWDWDPKETWALVALLVYLLILHGRIAGAWRGFGTAVGAVLGFQAVIMAWYGVNFVLGVGLHSYGFGSGGVQYAMLFVVAELSLVLVAMFRQRGRMISRNSAY